jgi:hypothetical protein
MEEGLDFGRINGLVHAVWFPILGNTYMILNEKYISLRDAWDGVNLRMTFTRTIDSRMMSMWLEAVHISSAVEFIEDDDSIIWQCESSCKYSV